TAVATGFEDHRLLLLHRLGGERRGSRCPEADKGREHGDECKNGQAMLHISPSQRRVGGPPLLQAGAAPRIPHARRRAGRTVSEAEATSVVQPGTIDCIASSNSATP